MSKAEQTIFLLFFVGTDSRLVPPWQIFMGEVLSVAILLSISLESHGNANGPFLFMVAIAISTVLTVMFVSVLGVGHTWSLASTIGKTVATFLSLAYPILLTAVAIVSMRKREARLTTLWSVSIALSVLLTLPMILVGVILACAATGDCL